VTSIKRFPTRDHHRMGLVAVEGLKQFIYRADPSLETGPPLVFIPRLLWNTFEIATRSEWAH